MVRGRTGGEPSTSRRQFYIGTRLVKFPMKKIRRKKPRGEIFDGKLPMCQCTYETTIYGPHSIALCCMGSGKKFGTKWLCYCPLIISIMQLFGDFETTLKLSLHRSNWRKCDFILRFIFLNQCKYVLHKNNGYSYDTTFIM